MDLLDPPVRPYAWGSRTAIASIQGRAAPTPQPEAELWMGAHPTGPARLVRDGAARTLTEVVTADPAAELGAAVAAEYGPRLPFLLKLLAADEPLSIQAHPDGATARVGYAREEAAGVPVDSPRRTYVDPYAKPELLCAVTEFHALCGFRDPAESADLLAGLAVPRLTGYVDRLRARLSPDGLSARPDTGPADMAEHDGLREVFTALMTLPAEEQGPLLKEALAACEREAGTAARFAADYALAVDLAKHHPGDVGALSALLFNRVRLAPGEAIFTPPGMLHAYLGGVGIELMGASDNVLRGGLTSKHVDVAELLRVARFTAGPVRPQPYTEPAAGVRVWSPPVREFSLTRVVLAEAGGAVTLPVAGPTILFCLEGPMTADDGTAPLTLPGGASAFVPAGRPVTLSGTGTVFAATTPAKCGNYGRL